MKKAYPYFISLTFLVLLFTISSCNNKIPDDQPLICNDISPTYETDIKVLINTSCAYSGCHSGGTAPGNFTSYNGILPYLENGTLKERVVNQASNSSSVMPPSYAPDGRPKELTQEEKDLIHCWIIDGYPEN